MKRLKLDVETTHDTGFSVTAYEQETGGPHPRQRTYLGHVQIMLNRDHRRTWIQWSEVIEKRRRTGVGTALYLKAAQETCRRWNVPLRSGGSRSPMAEGFWAKQRAKGRAIFDGSHYMLRCPAPRTLKGW